MTSRTEAEIIGRLRAGKFPERSIADLVAASGFSPEQSEAFEKLTAKVQTGGISGIVGPRGTGKTLITTAIAWRTMTNPSPMMTVRYAHAMDVFLEVRAAFRAATADSERDVVAGFVKPTLLVLDEIQERGETEWESKLLNVILDKRHGAMRPTVIIGNLTAGETAARLGASIIDRMHQGGGFVIIDGKSKRRQANEPKGAV